MSPAVEIRPSPEGVPGAITDPSSILGERIVFAGAEGDPIDGYLAIPAEPAGEHGDRKSVV